MRLRRNGLPCDVAQRTRARAERQRTLTHRSLYCPPKNQENKEDIGARGKRETSNSETGRGRQTKCAAQITATQLDKLQCAEATAERAKEEAGETTNKKSPDADSDEILSPWSLAAAPGGRQRPEGQ